MAAVEDGKKESRMDDYLPPLPDNVDQACDDYLKTWNPPGPEPILTPNPDRFMVDPVQHPDLYHYYKTHFDMFWRVEQVDLSHDKRAYDAMPKKCQTFLIAILSYFATADALIMDNLGKNFTDEVEYMEAKLFFGFQNMMEGIHARMYSKLLMTYVTDPAERQKHRRAMDTSHAIACKAKWARRWMSRDKPFAMRLFAFYLIELLFFTGSFAGIFWAGDAYGLDGLVTSNEYIAKDETIHYLFSLLVYKMHIRYKLDVAIMVMIIRDCIENAEDVYIKHILPEELPGMTASMMHQYVRSLANHAFVAIGSPALYHVPSGDKIMPLMERISVKVDYSNFEKHNTNYQNIDEGQAEEHPEDGSSARLVIGSDF